MASTNIRYADSDKIKILETVIAAIKKGVSKTKAAMEVQVDPKSIAAWCLKYKGKPLDEITGVPSKQPVKKEAATTAKKPAAKKPIIPSPAGKKAAPPKKTPPVKKAVAEVIEPQESRLSIKKISLPNSLVLAIGSESFEIKKDSVEQYKKVSDFVANRETLSEDEFKELKILINGEVVEKLKEWTDGRLTIKNGLVLFDKKPLNSGLQAVLIRCFNSGDSSALERYSKFIEKVNTALSFKVTTRLFDFVKNNSLAIADDGDILAYKVVRGSYYDKHSNTFNNSPGSIVEMPRNQVNDDDQQTCSNGLHVCSEGYIKSFSSSGDKLVLCKINPGDFVSIPVDYNSTKARVCRYEVLKDITEEWKKGQHIQYTDDHKFV